MSTGNDTQGRTDEYHARQQANVAQNEAAVARRALSDTQLKLRRARLHLRRTLEILQDAPESAVRVEIEAALRELDKL